MLELCSIKLIGMYKIKLPNFEGPFDLLLYFIQRDELNIYDIPIAKITEEFLTYIKIMQQFDIELAGEFIVMSSHLMYIKTQMLLPRPQTDEDGEEIEDPRTELVEQLLEYKQIKEAAEEINELHQEQRYTYYRHLFDADLNRSKSIAEYSNAGLFDLIKAFNRVIDRNKEKNLKHVVDVEPITIEEKSNEIISKLNSKKRISFFKLVDNAIKIEIIVTFLSLLELIKQKRIFIFQKDNFDDIVIAQKEIENYN